MTNEDIRGLYEKYGSWIFNRARSLLKDEQAAYEAMQDVFVKVMEAGSAFRGDSSPWTWLYRITTNHCLNMIRSRKAWKRALEGVGREQIRLMDEPQENADSVLINKEWFVKQMADEDETTQHIIFYYYFDEMTQEEIVETLGISRKTVYKKLKKFMNKARERL